MKAIKLDKLLTCRQAGEILGMAENTIRGHIYRRDFPFVKIGRNVRIKESFVRELIEKGEVPVIGAGI